MSTSDPQAGARDGRGEANAVRAATSASEREVEANWSRQEFLRNTWTAP